MIYDEDVVKTYWNVKHNDTLGMKNTKFWIINQHMNATSHMQSLERTFTLMPLAPLTTTHQSNESENHAWPSPSKLIPINWLPNLFS
jgi:hypothetical protein